jgi:two-component system CheB/CheR fusion protein
MAAPMLRSKLRTAVQKAITSKQRVSMAAPASSRAAGLPAFHVDVRPLICDGEHLLLVAFVDDHDIKSRARVKPSKGDQSETAELELELHLTRKELQDAIRDLELSGEEQKAINEEALSVNEEYQSTNE